MSSIKKTIGFWDIWNLQQSGLAVPQYLFGNDYIENIKEWADMNESKRGSITLVTNAGSISNLFHDVCYVL